MDQDKENSLNKYLQKSDPIVEEPEEEDKGHDQLQSNPAGHANQDSSENKPEQNADQKVENGKQNYT